MKHIRVRRARTRADSEDQLFRRTVLERCSGSEHRPLLIVLPTQTHEVLGINEDNILLQASTARPVDERATGKPRSISFFPNPL